MAEEQEKMGDSEYTYIILEYELCRNDIILPLIDSRLIGEGADVELKIIVAVGLDTPTVVRAVWVQ